MTSKTTSVVLLALSLTLLSAPALDSRRSSPEPTGNALDLVAALPLDFVENQAQGRFVARHGRFAASLEPGVIDVDDDRVPTDEIGRQGHDWLLPFSIRK